MSTSTAPRAVIWHGPGATGLVPREAVAPSPRQVVLHVESVGICGTDVSVWRGHSSRAVPGTVFGHEFGGTVISVGTEVDSVLLGDRVAVDPNLTCGHCAACESGSRGLCAERRLMGIDVDGGLRTEVTVDAAQLIPVPGNPDPVALALVEPLAVGVHACARAGIRAGIVVGIMGGGAIGMAAALQAREIGATVQIIEPDIARREAARALGYHATPPGQPVGREWDAAIDTVGIESTIAAAFGNVRQASTICVVGLASGHHLPASEDLVRREITLLGSFCYTSDDLLTAAALVGAYGLECIPFESISGLENAPDALDAFAGGRLGRGKTIIVP